MTFVGRSDQLGLLSERLEVVDDGRASIVLLRGIAGSGKTALVSEFLARINTNTAPMVSVVSCNQYAEESFSVFKRVVANLADGDANSAAETVRRRAAAMGEVMLEIGPAFVSLVFPPAGLIGDVGKFLLSQSRKTRGSAIESMGGYRDSLREPSSDFVEFFRRAAGESMLVIVIDDLHWADEASIALFGRLASYLSQTPELPILMIGSYRGHEVSADVEHTLGSILNQVTRYWGDAVINLDAVDDSERLELTRGLVKTFSGQGLNDEFATELHERTEGTPLLVNEFLQAMASAGDLTQTDGGLWNTSTDVNWDQAPISFDASVAERLKSLTPGARTVLNMAAVQGIEFSANVVALALGQDIDEVLAALSDELGQDRHGFVRDLDAPALGLPVFTFRFQHAEYQRFIYESLTPSIKARSHQKIAVSISEFYADVQTEMALEIAGHWTKAKQPNQAAPYFLRAANAALDAGDLSGAGSAAMQGVEGSAQLDPAIDAELHLITGHTKEVHGSYTAALPYLRRACEIASAHGLDQIEAQSLVWLGSNSWRRNVDEEAWKLLSAGLSRARDLGDRATEAQALRNLGVLARRAGDADRGLLLYEQSEEIGRDAGLDAAVTAAINNRATLVADLYGDFDVARELYVEAVSIAERVGNRSGQALYLHNLAGEQSRLGDQRGAIETAKEGLAMSRSVGNPLRESMCHVDIGEANMRLSRWSEASEEFRYALDISSELQGDHPYQLRAQTKLALSISRAENDLEVAIAFARQSVRLKREFGTSSEAWLVYSPETVLAALLFNAGNRGEAVASLDPESQVIPSGTDAWWMRWQRALESVTYAAIANDSGRKERALRRVRIAVVTNNAAGVVSDAQGLVQSLMACSLDTSFLQEVLAVVDSPSPRIPPATSAQSDRDRLNTLAARFRQIMAETRLEPFRTPIGHDTFQRDALRDIDANRDPVFSYEPVAHGIESPLIDMMRDLDPARSLWDELLYESVEDQHDLLIATRSRDPAALTKASIDAFGAPSGYLIREATLVLESISRPSPTDAHESAEVAARSMRTALSKLGLSSWTVAIDGQMNALMSVSHESNTIRIRGGSMFSEDAIRRLTIHEIGTHVLRAENGRRQSLDLLAMGIGRNSATEEGLASFNETLAGLDDPATSRKYALRTLAADLTQRHGFLEVYHALLEHTDREEAFQITMRAKRGIEDTSAPGGFVKDHVYLSGVLQVRRTIERDPGAYDLLMAAKVPLNLLPVLRDLRDASVLVEPAYLPNDLVG